MNSKYRVELTPTAEAVYTRIFEEAREHIDRGNTSHPKVKLLRMVDECIDTIIPHDPLDRKRALTGALSNIYRVKKGRMRICYIVSSQRITITVLYISETLRKEGDRSDPYTIFTNLVLSGVYDDVFAKLGLRKPQRKTVPPLSIQ